MAIHMNTVVLAGNLGADPETKVLQNGTALCNMSLAITESVKRGGEWQKDTTWLDVTCFGKTAENCGKYLSKGSNIVVEGRIQKRKWQDKDGKNRYSVDIIANKVHFGEKKSSGSGQQQGGFDPNDDTPF